MPTIATLANIAKVGGGMTIDAKSLTVASAANLVRGAAPKCIITFKNAGTYTSASLSDIAKAAGCQVVFDFVP